MNELLTRMSTRAIVVTTAIVLVLLLAAVSAIGTMGGEQDPGSEVWPEPTMPEPTPDFTIYPNTPEFGSGS
jgi:hypothetical protein